MIWNHTITAHDRLLYSSCKRGQSPSDTDTGEYDDHPPHALSQADHPHPHLPQVPEYAKSQVPGFMDLNLDLLSRNDEIITVALSHYYEQNGDLILDPDIVIRIDTKNDTVEAVTFQDTIRTGRFTWTGTA
ncbi:MAG: hypothetical protein L0Z68_08750 [Gammaproteobacteria bacterium]|nr:hypothetical protein [Gammaproteobacteria bacterium]